MVTRTASTVRPRRGFTLIEVMIVIVIIGILSAIAIPAYSRYTLRGNRAPAKAMLAELVSKQEAYKLKTRGYAADFGALGVTTGTATQFWMNRGGDKVAANSAANSVYQVTFGTSTTLCGTTNSGTVVATAVNAQLKDTACKIYTMCYSGQKQATNSAGSATAAVTKACWDG